MYITRSMALMAMMAMMAALLTLRKSASQEEMSSVRFSLFSSSSGRGGSSWTAGY